MNRATKLLGGIFLVSGTTIGAGMLALPIVTGLAGFFPAALLFLAYWIYMTYTAFLMLEANLWSGENTNLISMAKMTLGKIGEVASWIVYLFLLYSLTTAYLAAGGPIFMDFFESITGISTPDWIAPLPLLLIFGYFVWKGTHTVDLMNRLLMIGLVVTYGAMVYLLRPHISAENLTHMDFSLVTLSISVVATSFGFHIIIPTLTTYVHRDLSLLKKTIFIGSLIPLLTYLIWDYLALGIIPLNGSAGILSGYHRGANGVQLLTSHINNQNLVNISRFFSFFAIVTSFLGVSLSLSDFLSDGLKIKQTHQGRLTLCFLTFFPPLLITLTNPRAFLLALQYAGAFGVVILLGLIPALMVWAGRYRHFYYSTFKAPGGKFALIMTMLVSLIIISLEICLKTGMLKIHP